jgi:hypothetical protein
MPIVDDRLKGTDRKTPARWSWIVALVVFCGVWLAIASLGMLGSFIRSNQQAALAPGIMRSINTSYIQTAESSQAQGNWSAAASMIDAVDETQPLDLMEKHRYLRIGGVSKAKNGQAAESAAFYERFLSLGVQIGNSECQGCHGQGSVPPGQLSDLETSDLGTEYWRQLKASGKLDGTRKRLRKEWKEKPKDARLNLLLYHLEKRSGDAKAAVKHAEALRTVPTKIGQ